MSTLIFADFLNDNMNIKEYKDIGSENPYKKQKTCSI